MGRCLVISGVCVALRIAVIKDLLLRVNEVTGSLNGLCIGIIGGILIFLLGVGSLVVFGECNLHSIGVAAYAMHVLGINETAAQARHNINEVKFHNTGSYTPVLILGSTVLSG